MTATIAEEDLISALELLRFVAELCAARRKELHRALSGHTDPAYGAHQLLREVVEVGDALAKALGLVDLSMEPAR